MRSNRVVTRRCSLSKLTNSAPRIQSPIRREGVGCWVSANENSCAHPVTWSPNKHFGDLTPYLTCRLERLTANAKVPTVLDSILYSSIPPIQWNQRRHEPWWINYGDDKNTFILLILFFETPWGTCKGCGGPGRSAPHSPPSGPWRPRRGRPGARWSRTAPPSRTGARGRCPSCPCRGSPPLACNTGPLCGVGR